MRGSYLEARVVLGSVQKLHVLGNKYSTASGLGISVLNGTLTHMMGVVEIHVGELERPSSLQLPSRIQRDPSVVVLGGGVKKLEPVHRGMNFSPRQQYLTSKKGVGRLVHNLQIFRKLPNDHQVEARSSTWTLLKSGSSRLPLISEGW
jgi:hypothetical protein